MKAGILAAGWGERLRAQGVTLPKPLVSVGGQPLIARLLHAVRQCGIAEVVCIVNAAFPEVARYCQERDWGMPTQCLSKSTVHSLESFLTLQPHLEAEPFLLLTIDAVFPRAALSSFLHQARHYPEADGVLGVTPFVDDEKPLWAMLDGDKRILRLGPSAQTGGLVTAGVYFFAPSVFREAEAARRRKFTAFRQFLAHLVTSGYGLYGYLIPKVIDVDRPADIVTAEALLAELGEE
ncbi:MAG: NDP-sugar synthase [Candidatus Binatia bacterium]